MTRIEQGGSRYAPYGAALWAGCAYTTRCSSVRCTIQTTRSFFEIRGTACVSANNRVRSPSPWQLSRAYAFYPSRDRVRSAIVLVWAQNAARRSTSAGPLPLACAVGIASESTIRPGAGAFVGCSCVWQLAFSTTARVKRAGPRSFRGFAHSVSAR